jgi:predicted alpha/beta superfamily hydrolase
LRPCHRPHPFRSLDYTPYKPGTGPNGFRKDALDWPGGEVDAYVERVINEVMPFARRTYKVSSGRRFWG